MNVVCMCLEFALCFLVSIIDLTLVIF
uniref:Uncharacterized protein n=1 Tax=Anguilla anguilla TaxID=7936 RepID=A0A0E9PR88_ANGAN